jgi:hypothetical protein
VVRAEVAGAWSLYHSAGFARLLTLLPGMTGDARLLPAAGSPKRKAGRAAALGKSLQPAGHLPVRLGKAGLAPAGPLGREAEAAVAGCAASAAPFGNATAPAASPGSARAPPGWPRSQPDSSTSSPVTQTLPPVANLTGPQGRPAEPLPGMAAGTAVASTRPDRCWRPGPCRVQAGRTAIAISQHSGFPICRLC